MLDVEVFGLEACALGESKNVNAQPANEKE